MVEEIIVYKTSDGVSFENYQHALKHENDLALLINSSDLETFIKTILPEFSTAQKIVISEILFKNRNQLKSYLAE